MSVGKVCGVRYLRSRGRENGEKVSFDRYVLPPTGVRALCPKVGADNIIKYGRTRRGVQR